MNMKFVLLAVFAALGVVAVAQYQAGYWDTWSGQKDAIVAEILEKNKDSGIESEPLNFMADCVAGHSVTLAELLECPLVKDQYLNAISNCAIENSVQDTLSSIVISCMISTQEYMQSKNP